MAGTKAKLAKAALADHAMCPALIATYLAGLGYCRTSNRHRMISRIDREDWQEHMALEHAPWDIEQGRKWVECLGRGAADHYRRVYASDDLSEIRADVFSFMPGSGWNPTGYIP